MARSKAKVDLLGSGDAAVTQRARAVSAAFRDGPEKAPAGDAPDRLRVQDMSKTTVRMDPEIEAIIDRVHAAYFESVPVIRDGRVVRTKTRSASKQKFMAWLFEVALADLGHLDTEEVRAKYQRHGDI